MKNKVILFVILVLAIGCERSQRKSNSIDIVYYENGIIKKRTFVDENERFCLETYFHSGNLNCRYSLEKFEEDSSILNGPYYCLYETGDTLSKGEYNMGRLIGRREWYYSDGNISRIEMRRKDSVGINHTFDQLGNITAYSISYLEKNFYICRYPPKGSRLDNKSMEGSPVFMVRYDVSDYSSPRPFEGMYIIAQEPHIRGRSIRLIEAKNYKTKEDLYKKVHLSPKDSLIVEIVIDSPYYVNCFFSLETKIVDKNSELIELDTITYFFPLGYSS